MIRIYKTVRNKFLMPERLTGYSFPREGAPFMGNGWRSTLPGGILVKMMIGFLEVVNSFPLYPFAYFRVTFLKLSRVVNSISTLLCYIMR